MTKDPDGQEADSVGVADTRLPSLTIDYDLYARFLEDSGMSDAQKKEFIETLWSVIVSFVDLGFGMHPLQQICESNAAIPDMFAPDSGLVLDLDEPLQTPKNIDAAPPAINGRGSRGES